MRQGKTRGDKTLGKADTPSNKEKQEGVQGDKGRQGETRGDKSFGKADKPSNKGKQEGRQGETRGDKTLGKADTPSNKEKQEGAQGETRGDKGRQDPREGGHTIQHQGGHLKKALRTANGTLLGETCFSCIRLVAGCKTRVPIIDLQTDQASSSIKHRKWP